jgi:hypothetical protein
MGRACGLSLLYTTKPSCHVAREALDFIFDKMEAVADDVRVRGTVLEGESSAGCLRTWACKSLARCCLG